MECWGCMELSTGKGSTRGWAFPRSKGLPQNGPNFFMFSRRIARFVQILPPGGRTDNIHKEIVSPGPDYRLDEPLSRPEEVTQGFTGCPRVRPWKPCVRDLGRHH